MLCYRDYILGDVLGIVLNVGTVLGAILLLRCRSQPSMTEVLHFLAHGANPIRGLSFGPTDSKFASCSDDSTVSAIQRSGGGVVVGPDSKVCAFFTLNGSSYPPSTSSVPTTRP